MFYHVKELQFNARVSGPDPRFASLLLEQFGGGNGELKAALQYFVQAFGARQPYPEKTCPERTSSGWVHCALLSAVDVQAIREKGSSSCANHPCPYTAGSGASVRGWAGGTNQW